MDYNSRQKGLILNLNSRWCVIFVFIMMFPFGNTGHEPLCKKSFFRFLTAEKVLAQIEEDKTVTSAMAFIQPPSDGFDSEGDSGNEDTGGRVNNLSGKQVQGMPRRELFCCLGLRKAMKGTTKLVVSLLPVLTVLNFL